ncbi:copper chaperone PCu(A)C [Streptomyces scopuliridis]|uniref:Copper chaperone PCu(A)C n=1 Tax=Streptomyces scopuliridis TaxID=452529 RepID=A0ACD4ZMU4_9ACTN|nr:copper chaperone PCu(A)C [Streptomyces scopuliridis]WSB99112.1 copper chaperone PCu(A)C [Streptomyces scopuliridis]WSC07185.1 copper chaperone PCu(A)C [Streptomyces scopuliridis]
MNRRAPLALAACLTAALALAGCSSASSASSSSSDSSANPSANAPQLKVSGGYMPRPVGDLAAGFLVVTNSGGAADKLTSVTSDISDDITIHSTENQKMRKVKSFDIPAGGELNLARGGNHIMFMGLKQQPEQGQKVGIELHFEKSGPIKVELPVKEINYNPAQR